MLTLYQLADQYAELLTLAASDDEVNDAQAFTDTLESLAGEIKDKIENCAAIVTTLFANAEGFEAEIDRLAKRRKAMLANADRLKSYMQNCMAETRIERVDGTLFTVAIQNNPPGVAIDDAGAIPEEFMRVKREPDKATIAATLKGGGVVPGCRLEQTKSLRIR